MTTTFAPATAAATHTPAAAPAAPRFDMYLTIHKALRSFMADTLVRVGRLDVTDEEDMQDALEQLDALLVLCGKHIDHENEFVHTAIEARQPGGASRTVGDHLEHRDSIDVLRAEGAALRRAAAATRPQLALRLYHHLSLFVAENFQHMHIEESTNNALLWAAYSDVELIDIHHRLLATISPESFMQIARWMVPAMNPSERAMMLGGVKATTPPEAFLGVLAGIRSHLDASGWTKLSRAMGVPAETLP